MSKIFIYFLDILTEINPGMGKVTNLPTPPARRTNPGPLACEASSEHIILLTYCVYVCVWCVLASEPSSERSGTESRRGHADFLNTQSINQSWGAYAGGRVASPTLRRHSWRSRLASPNAGSFLYRITPSRRHRLAAAKSSVGVP